MSKWKYWKEAERIVARIIGGERNRSKGMNDVDVLHSWLAPEVKSMENIPKWLIEAISQAEANAPEDKLPMVVVVEKGSRGGKSDEQAGMCLAIIRLQTFSNWFVNTEQKGGD